MIQKEESRKMEKDGDSWKERKVQLKTQLKKREEKWNIKVNERKNNEN